MYELMKSYIKQIIASIVCFMLLVGCVQHYSKYGFEIAIKDFEWGVLHARLVGSRHSYIVKVFVGSPYEMIVWFDSDSVIEGSIKITGLQLLDAQTKKVLFNVDKTIEESFQVYTQEAGSRTVKQAYSADFYINNIELKYVDMLLQVNFMLNKQGDRVTETEYQVELPFKKKYEKYFTMASH